MLESGVFALKGRLVYILPGVAACVGGSWTAAFGGLSAGNPIQKHAGLSGFLYCCEELIAAKVRWPLEKEVRPLHVNVRSAPHWQKRRRVRVAEVGGAEVRTTGLGFLDSNLAFPAIPSTKPSTHARSFVETHRYMPVRLICSAT